MEAILIGNTILAEPSIISADVVVNLALSYGNFNIYLEWDNRPSGIFGKEMKYGEAVQYKTTQPIPPQENIARMSDVPVWLILLQGNYVEHIPAAPGSPGIPEKEIHHNQIALIIDGVSGDFIEAFWVSPQEGLPFKSSAGFDAAVGYRAPGAYARPHSYGGPLADSPDRPVRHHRTDLKEVMMRFIKLLSLLIIFIMTGCQVQPILETPTRLPAPQTLTAPSETSNPPTLSHTQIPPSPTPSSTPLPLLTATTIPMPSPTALPPLHPRQGGVVSPSGGPPEPTPAATRIAPFVQGSSIGAFEWSPDSRWLPLINFNMQTLQFYDALQSVLCDFPVPIRYTPDRSLAWLSDGRVVVQAADQVLAGRPCETFTPASANEILTLDHTDPSFSPDGVYQVVFQRGAGNSQGVEATIELKEVASGKILSKTTFTDLPRGGANLPGSWLDPTHFLIHATG